MVTFLVITIVTWIFGLACSMHYLRLAYIAKKAKRQETHITCYPPVSIVMTVHNQARNLRQNLPTILTQDYPAPFEVIIVDMNSDDDTRKLLERMEEQYVHLHHTFCPDTARDISLSRLALTLGFRSACYEWVLIMTPDACPHSNEWLTGMAQSMSKDVDAVQGFVYYEQPQGWSGIKQHFFRLWQQSIWMPWCTHFTPYRADDSCLAYRKSLFMKHQGFASNFSLRYGAADLLVNHNVTRKRMGLALKPQDKLQEAQHSTQEWEQQRMFFMETRHHMRHKLLYCMWYATRLNACHIWILPAIYTLLFLQPHIYIMYSFGIMWFLSLLTACLSWHIMARSLHVSSYALLLPILQALIPWWDLKAWIHWRFESKKTFRKKFV
ncbi:MAG: glycosyltransferase [Bacteroidaceae bacterium]